MKHHIDPKVDCVFKKLLGSEEIGNGDPAWVTVQG